MPKYYRVTRRKQARGKKYALVFEWTEGAPHIYITFKGRLTPFDTIGVFDHATATCTITTHQEFIESVNDYMKGQDHGSLSAAFLGSGTERERRAS